MSYRQILSQDELQAYLSGATYVAFDFETAPDKIPQRRKSRARHT